MILFDINNFFKVLVNHHSINTVFFFIILFFSKNKEFKLYFKVIRRSKFCIQTSVHYNKEKNKK